MRQQVSISEEIDLLVSIAGRDEELVLHNTTVFLHSLVDKCNLEGINVWLVFREHWPLSILTQETIGKYNNQFKTCICPLELSSNCCEDTGRMVDWMIDNVGNAPWVCISHFDIQFHADYFQYIRPFMQNGASMIGRHHDGICTLKRSVYKQCHVGFFGIDSFRIARNSDGQLYIVSANSPRYKDKTTEFCLSLDVGELLELRIATLGLWQVWHSRETDPSDAGKSNTFTHYRNGSAHAAGNTQTAYIQGNTMNQVTTADGRTVIHLHVIIGNRWCLACMPNEAELGATHQHANFQMSGDPRAVNCIACKNTTSYKTTMDTLVANLGGRRA